MAIYTISDLHLPLGVDKPMDIFGKNWANYVDRLADNWQSVVSPDDTVVLPGDFSWAMYLDEAIADFEFLDKLNGKKILLKGNHDYWWETVTKLNSFVAEHNYKNISFLNNNYFVADGVAICGSRSWNVPKFNKTAEDKKIYNRELLRIAASIDSATVAGYEKKLLFLHFPPLLADGISTPVCELLEEKGICECYYGHIHSNSRQNAYCGIKNGIKYTLCSCDCVNFTPIKILD